MLNIGVRRSILLLRILFVVLSIASATTAFQQPHRSLQGSVRVVLVDSPGRQSRCFLADKRGYHGRGSPFLLAFSTGAVSKRKCSLSALSSSIIEDATPMIEEESDANDSNNSNNGLPEPYLDRFGGVGRLYSSNKINKNKCKQENTFDSVMERMRRAVVVVVGLGGVGSWTAEALCRSGVGNLVLVDLDDICISNTNRQLHATTSRIGQMKIDVMKERLLDINPDCNITLVHDFVSIDNAKAMLQNIGPAPTISTVIDAIDNSPEKAALIGACTDLRIPVITCGGSAGRRDPFQIITGDLVHAEDDRLLASCRKILRQDHGFPVGMSFSQQRVTQTRMKKWRIPCVYTREQPPPKSTDRSAPNSSGFRLCDGSLGTACFVTGTYGFAMASLCVDMIARNKLLPPRRR